MIVLSGYNPDNKIRHLSSSGGIFTLCAEKILKENGIVYGASFCKNWDVKHIRITQNKELSLLRGSKYVYSHVGECYNYVISDLNKGYKVLFSGTPCQIAALRKKVGNHPELYLVEVVCHGAPELKYWQQYLSEICKKLNKEITDISSINFRDKKTGWKDSSFTIKFKDGKKFTQRKDDNLYIRAFVENFILREACYRCPFKYPNGSRADVTIGDFWGIDVISPKKDNDLGTSIIICNSIKSQYLISEIKEYCDNLDFNKIVQYNKAIISSPQKPNNIEYFHKEISNGWDNVSKFFPLIPFKVKFKIRIIKFLKKIGYRR